MPSLISTGVMLSPAILLGIVYCSRFIEIGYRPAQTTKYSRLLRSSSCSGLRGMPVAFANCNSCVCSMLFVKLCELAQIHRAF